MITVKSLSTFLSTFFPLELAEEWDNVGLLVGTDEKQVQKMMLCLTITPEVVQEALSKKVDFILCHHPLPFTGIKRITRSSYEGAMLLDLIGANIAIYSAHTAYDGMHGGINEQIAHILGLVSLKPIFANSKFPSLGAGRMGYFKKPKLLEELLPPLKEIFELPKLNVVKGVNKTIESMAIACGAGSNLLDKAIQLGHDLFITGELSFHKILLAKGKGMSLVIPGHFATERFAMKTLALRLQKEFHSISIVLSEEDVEPSVFL